ncbi:helix-turn-helix transcriptional regulator [Kitasatospora sp. NPDC057738]|uniref:helix-turn-helix transcriptional regulator n=1 Tax=Kitasatospora sp. NPDC057738 TaxID=3346233 RepID=UPI0036C3E4F6
MSGIFHQIESSARKIFGDEPVCVHVGNVQDCDIKRHPTYPKFRTEAILAGVRSAPSSRLWESLIAMGRLCDLDGDDTWRLVILDCIVPCFRSLSTRIARDFRVELEEIRSAMVVTALEVWAATAAGVPPRLVRDRIVKAAFEVAFQRGKTSSPELMTDQLDVFAPPEIPVVDHSMQASSIIDVSRVRSAEVAEQIRGERLGALLHGLGCFDAVQDFHEDMRAGRRSGSISQAVKATGLSRSRFSNSNLYYYASDLYPSFIGLREAAGVIGLPESTAYRLIRAGQFPLPVARAGRSYKVSVRALMHFTDIPDAIVHADDIENGALHARGAAQ